MDTYANDGTQIGSDDNTGSWYAFAQRPQEQGGLGLAPHQAAGVVGNLMQESGGGIPSWGPTGDNGSAWGAAQWRNDRLDGLKQFAKDNGLDHKSTEAQQKWMKHELETTHSDAYDALKAAKSPEQAANVFNRQYEISADRSGSRAANARAVFTGPDAVAKLKLGRGAMAYANDDDDEDEGTPQTAATAQPALAPEPGALTKGQWKQLLKGEPASKMSTVGSTMAQMGAALAGVSNPSQGYVLSALAKQIADGGKSTYKTALDKSGNIIQTDDEGNVRVAPGLNPASTAAVKLQMKNRKINGVDVTGNYNSKSGEWTPLDPKDIDAAQKYGVDNLPDKYEDLKDLNEGLYNQVNDAKLGRIPYPTTSTRNPQATLLRSALSKYFPGVDGSAFTKRQQFEKNTTTDTPSSPGGQQMGLNHSVDLLGQIADQSQGLNNFDAFPGAVDHGLNMAWNAASNKHSAAGDQLEGTVHKFSGESGRIYSGAPGGGTAAEREAIGAQLNKNSSKAEAASFLEGNRDALLSRHSALYDQAKDSLGEDAEKRDFVGDSGRTAIKKINDAIDKMRGDKVGTAEQKMLDRNPSYRKLPGSGFAAQTSLPKGWSVE